MPTGEWWERAKKFVTPIEVSVPRKIYGNKLYHYAHQTDVLRILILLKFGGIYLDIDTVCIKPFRPLLSFDCVMGKQLFINKKYGLCNAVILAQKNSKFLQLWLSPYKEFRSKGCDQYWDEHSVIIPYQISQCYPKLIHIENQESFFYPSYFPSDLKLLFEENKSFSEAYIFHLWESLSYQNYLLHINEKFIRTIETTYNKIAKNYI